jgi:hypothetical protein
MQSRAVGPTSQAVFSERFDSCCPVRSMRSGRIFTNTLVEAIRDGGERDPKRRLLTVASRDDSMREKEEMYELWTTGVLFSIVGCFSRGARARGKTSPGAAGIVAPFNKPLEDT